MDTNSNIPPQKKIVSVEILHLDELGYGPQGKHTRREWRKECLENLLAGKKQFEDWQNNWKDQIDTKLGQVSFCADTTYADGSESHDWQSRKRVPYSLDFEGHTFSKDLACQGYVFQQNALFRNATITWASDVDFTGATFSGHADFSGVIFEVYADFSGVIFNGSADFRDTIFTGYANFDRVIFTEITSFSGASFAKRDAYFGNTTFNSIANFYGAIFSKDAIFYKAKFKSQCRFDPEIERDKQQRLKETEFHGAVYFENAEIDTVGHFEGVRFKGEMPNFLGVDNSKTLLIFSGEECFNKEDTTEDAVKRIGQLKRLADEQGQTDQALMFNAIELNAKRAQARIKIESLTILQKLGNSDFWFANATVLYDKFSSYGRSFTKPLKYYLGLLVVIYILALGNAVVNSPKDCKAENLRMLSDLWRDDALCDISKTNPDDKTRLNGYRAAAEYTVYRAAGILDFSDNGKATDAVARRLFGQSYEPGWMRFIGLIKAIASTALLFLAALGLRNKYRIK